MIKFLRDNFYKGKPQTEDDSFIKSEARKIAKQDAQQMVYDWNQYEPFESFGAAEIRAVIYGLETA
jgi:hypothetical protein